MAEQRYKYYRKYTDTAWRILGFETDEEREAYLKHMILFPNSTLGFTSASVSLAQAKRQAEKYGRPSQMVIRILSKNGVLLYGDKGLKDCEVIFDKNQKFEVVEVGEQDGVLSVFQWELPREHDDEVRFDKQMVEGIMKNNGKTSQQAASLKPLKSFSFRDLLGNVVMFKDKFCLDAIKEFAPSPEINAVICYPYIDTEAGLSFWFVGAAVENGGKVEKVEDRDWKKVLMFRYSSVETLSCATLPSSVCCASCMNRVADYLKGYAPSEELAIVRGITLIDPCRHPGHPDDILVYLVKKGLNSEGVWVRSQRIQDSKIAGRLLNQPDQADFGVNDGDTICFSTLVRDGEPTCYWEAR